MVLISLRSCLFSLKFHFKALLFKLCVIQLKHSRFSLPGLERHTEKLLPFYLSYDKPFGELALGEKCKDYQSGQVIEFSRYVFGNTDRIIRLKCHVTASFITEM